MASARSSHHGMLMAMPLLLFERVAHDAVGAVAREDGFLDEDFAVGVGEPAAAKNGVFAFGVLPHDEEIDVAGAPAGQRAGHAVEQPDMAQVDVLVEFAPELQQRPPQRDMVGHGRGPAHGAEEDGVVALQLRFPVGRHHFAVFCVVLAIGPGEGLRA
ncbi:hypothetical protein G6F32_015048 [Rhizopus arrhizus]|nr:hypothetical protein G6F32_015048 [Rhizopus arrhizus]